DPVAGHIPGAHNSPFGQNLNTDGTFRTAQELAQRFADAGKSLLPVVCYCGSGVTACHNVLAMKHAGFETPVLYAGSWSEWVTDATRGVVTGALP
ncbi:MAG TPA: rhodanese-like domain-containing protein, partial [Hyphomicrobiales bacterium]|nr:rhodanese-like domain-containing protein [Hyphomicrobiales bacterium]